MNRVVGPNRWRARHSVVEALENVFSGGILSVSMVAVMAIASATLISADLGAAHDTVEQERAYLTAGGDLLLAQPGSDTGTIDAARCAALSTVEGVRTSFALDVEINAASLTGRPEAQQTVVTATAGVADLFGIAPLGANEAVASSVVADRWQWSEGSLFQVNAEDAQRLGLPTSPLHVVGVRDLGLLSEAASTGLLVTRPATGPAQWCFVQVVPAFRDDVAAVMPALLGETAGNSVHVAPRLPLDRFAQDPAVAFESRPTRWAGAAAGAFAGLVCAVVGWTRRGRAALYASIGVPDSAGVLIRWVEGILVVSIGILWGGLSGLLWALARGSSDSSLGIELTVRHVAVALAVASACVIVAGAPRPATLAALKDR